MEIRPAQPSDATAIARVHVRGWQLGYHGLLPQALLDSLDPADWVERWQKNIPEADLPRRGTLLAVEDDRLLGFVSVLPSPDEDTDPTQVGLVAALYVEPDDWRSGVGRHLMDVGDETMRAAGHQRAVLYVLDGNERAIDFYRALGWRPDGVTKEDRRGEYTFLDLRFAKALD